MPRVNPGTSLSFTYCAAGLHQPGRTYCKHCWPPRGRGKGEHSESPRRRKAWGKAFQGVKLWMGQSGHWRLGGPRYSGKTYTAIARELGYKDASGAWRAINRLKAQWEQQELIERGRFPDMQAAYQAIIQKEG